MTDIPTLKQLQRLTNAGLGECKRVLTESNGDLFVAATKMLTEQDVLEIQQSVRVRAMAGQSIKDPVTREEQELVDALLAHFVAQQTRSINVGFLVELTALFSSDKAFRKALLDWPRETLEKFRELLDQNNEFDGIQAVKTCRAKKFASTVIKMPPAQSEWESDFIILQHPKKGILFGSRPRVFSVYKRTKREDRGIANIDEVMIKHEALVSIARWVHSDLQFDFANLAAIGDDNGKRRVE